MTPSPLPGSVRVRESILGETRGERCRIQECQAACCSNGVWMDEGHAALLLAHAPRIASLLPLDRRHPPGWFEGTCEDDDFPSGRGLGTRALPWVGNPSREACVFLGADLGCILQRASPGLGLPPPGLKPFYCALYPVLLSQGELVMDQESPVHLGGGDCQRPREDGEKLPVLEVFAEEIRLALGEEEYRRWAGGENG